MDENYAKNLDNEFEQFLNILRPHISLLKNRKLAYICSLWIERLSACGEQEKIIRNKYVITLCYQLTKGTIDEPFLKEPTDKKLLPILEPSLTALPSSDRDCLVTDSQDVATKVLFNKSKSSTTDTEDSVQDTVDLERNGIEMFDTLQANGISLYKQMLSYRCPQIMKNYKDVENLSDLYGCRTNNIISKLRQLKDQNSLLCNELQEMKNKSSEDGYFTSSPMKVNTSSQFMNIHDSNSMLNSLKCKLKEVQDSRNALIDKIRNMQGCIDNFNELKTRDIEEIRANHALEIINVKSVVKAETKQFYEAKLNEQKQYFNTKIKELENNMNSTKDDVIAEKDEIIKQKDSELARLLEQSNNNVNLNSVLKKMANRLNEEQSDNFRIQNQILQRRVIKMEKAKTKCVKAYESKVASLQKEKHLIECSLQLQQVRQRAQIVKDTAVSSQAEIKKAVDKLEVKYRDIVASMQATAIQRRLEDQMAVAAVLQAASGIPNDTYNYCLPGIPKNVLHLRRDTNQNLDSELATLYQSSKMFGKVLASTPSKVSRDENGRFGELGNGFDKAYIPQRDNDKVQKKTNNLLTMPLS